MWNSTSNGGLDEKDGDREEKRKQCGIYRIEHSESEARLPDLSVQTNEQIILRVHFCEQSGMKNIN